MKHVLVIGGGIIGRMTARELLPNGKQVTKSEQHDSGRASPSAGGGIVSPR